MKLTGVSCRLAFRPKFFETRVTQSAILFFVVRQIPWKAQRLTATLQTFIRKKLNSKILLDLIIFLLTEIEKNIKQSV